MAQSELHLPQRLMSIAEKRAASAGYASVNDYIAALIEADQLAPISDDLEAEILKGLDSGPVVDITPQLLLKLKERARSGRGHAA